MEEECFLSKHLFSIVPNEERASAAEGSRPDRRVFYSEHYAF